MAGDFFKQAARAVGGFPDNYVSIDVETNGYKVDDIDIYPTQVGYTTVWGRKADDTNAIMINWGLTLSPRDARVFYDSVEETEYRMIQKGVPCHVSVARLRDEGVHPADAWPIYRGIIDAALAAGTVLVGHNIWHFDRVLLERIAGQFGQPMRFLPHLTIDVGLWEIGANLGWAPPADGPDVARFYADARRYQGKTKWSLSHCLDKYRIAIDHRMAHDAGHDTLQVHRLFEAMRRSAG